MQWLVLVDDLHLGFRNTGRVREALRRLIDEAASHGDSVAWRSTGPSELPAAEPTEPWRRGEAIKRVTGNGLRAADVIRSLTAADMRYQEPFYRASKTLSAARDWLRTTSGTPRRVLVFVSDGLPVAADAPSPASALGSLFERWESARASVRASLAALVAESAASRTPVLAYDPRDPALAAALEPGVDAAAQVALLSLQRDSLRTLAHATGGAFAEGSQELAAAMGTVRAAAVR